MYNGIGLQTPRGSGTNGYVQRNLSNIEKKRPKIEYMSEDELRRQEAKLTKKPNLDILKHQKKREIEVRCIEMQEYLAGRGYSQSKIDEEVEYYRKRHLERLEQDFERKDEFDFVKPEYDSHGKPIIEDSHQLAQLNHQKNTLLKESLGISESYVDGSSLNNISKTKNPAQDTDKNNIQPSTDKEMATINIKKERIKEERIDGDHESRLSVKRERSASPRRKRKRSERHSRHSRSSSTSSSASSSSSSSSSSNSTSSSSSASSSSSSGSSSSSSSASSSSASSTSSSSSSSSSSRSSSSSSERSAPISSKASPKHKSKARETEVSSKSSSRRKDERNQHRHRDERSHREDRNDDRDPHRHHKSNHRRKS